jgi:carboxyl-terminal processing protease
VTSGGSNSEKKQGKKRTSISKVLLSLIAALLIFAGGVSVGRGDLRFSKIKPTASNASLSNLDYSSVNQVYNLLRQDFDGNLDKTKLTEGLKAGLVQATGDPYTEYFDPQQAKDFNNTLAGTITGIGAEIGSDTNNHVQIVSPLSGYPADKAGLKPKDIIAAINGQSTSGLSVTAAVNKIRGPVGSQVTLTIVRNNGTPFDVTITREKITIPSVKYQEDGDIGYLKISQFSDDTVSLAQKAAQEFKDKNVKAVVLDLRGDPGGYLTGAVNISSLWLDQGKTVVSERRGGKVIATEQATGNNVLHGLPTVVLIDSGSASASEITAGALRDNGAATLLGVKSYGKGSVQQVECLDKTLLSGSGPNQSGSCNGAELKITIARWYTPNGKNIDKQGITPDTIVNLSDDDAKAGRDPQKDQAYQILQAKIQ